MQITRRLAMILSVAVLSACGGSRLEDPPVDLGNFRLGLNIVVTQNMQRVPISREATGEEWEAAIKKAVDDRFGRYEGDKFFNIGVAVEGYALAPPGIPIVASPKSILVVSVSVFDDAAGKMLNADGKGKQITAFEQSSGDTVIGSGLTRSKAQQMESLAYSAALEIERYLLENPEWFGLPPGPRDASAETE
jgi:hypothetical protein